MVFRVGGLRCLNLKFEEKRWIIFLDQQLDHLARLGICPPPNQSHCIPNLGGTKGQLPCPAYHYDVGHCATFTSTHGNTLFLLKASHACSCPSSPLIHFLNLVAFVGLERELQRWSDYYDPRQNDPHVLSSQFRACLDE